MSVSKLKNNYVSNLNSVKFGQTLNNTFAVFFFLIGFTLVLTYFKYIGTVPDSDYQTILAYVFGVMFSVPFISYLLNSKHK